LPAKDARKFWLMLLEMEENHEQRRSFSGAIDYSCFFQAVYRGRVQMDLRIKTIKMYEFIILDILGSLMEKRDYGPSKPKDPG
jgi:hypothetical protein